MKRFQIYLPVRMWQALKKDAGIREIPVAELIRRIIDKYLGQE